MRRVRFGADYVKGGNCDDFVTKMLIQREMSLPIPEYVADVSVNDLLDASLRNLLSACFTKTPVFRDRRYYNEPPAHRWLIRGPDGEPVAHVAVHEKQIFSGERVIPFGGIAEVCVHPDFRGQGYVGRLLAGAHAWLKDQAFPFAVLYGNPQYYSSSGYMTVTNLYRDLPDENGQIIRRPTEWAMVLPLGSQPWPEGEVYLPGPAF